jgi:hypothetical protein
MKIRERLYRRVHDILKIPEHLKLLKKELFNEGYEIQDSGFGGLVIKLTDGEIHFVAGGDGIHEYVFRQKSVLSTWDTCYNGNGNNIHNYGVDETMQIINAVGTVVHEGQVKYLYVAECACKSKLARAKTENGLKMYVGNEKFKCKECGNVLKYAGKAYFKGNHRLEASEVLNETDFTEHDEGENQEPMEEQVEKRDELKIEQTTKPINDVNGLIKGIRSKGVTNAQMISAIKENELIIDNLKALYFSYPDIYKASIRYLPVNVRKAAGGIVKAVEPDFNFDVGKRLKATYVTPQAAGESHG